MFTAQIFKKYGLIAMQLVGLLAAAVFMFDSYKAGTFTFFSYLLFWINSALVGCLLVALIQKEVSRLVAGMAIVLFLSMFLITMGALMGLDSQLTLRFMGFGVMISLWVLFVGWDGTTDSEVITNSHLVLPSLALLATVVLVTFFHQSVAKLVAVPYSFDAKDLKCEDPTADVFLAGWIANRQSILHGIATFSRPTSEYETLSVGELRITPYAGDNFRWSSELCGDQYCVTENAIGFSNGTSHSLALQYRVNRSLEIEELRVRVALLNADKTSVCAVTLTNSSGM